MGKSRLGGQCGRRSIAAATFVSIVGAERPPVGREAAAQRCSVLSRVRAELPATAWLTSLRSLRLR